MERNPYTPPAARVADGDLGRPANIPRQVVLATRLQWGAAIVGFAMSLFNTSNQEMLRSNPVGLAVVMAFGFVLTWWVTAKLRAGRNWMRILLLIFLAVGITLQLFGPRVTLNLGSKISVAVHECTEFVTLWLVFTRPGADWFRRARLASQP